MDYKTTILNSVEENIAEYMEVVQHLYDHPEIGNQEFETVKVLTAVLKKHDFEVTLPYIVPTGFVGKYATEKPGPTIAVMCEFDALPEVGHGCGHNLIAGIGLAAGIALKKVMAELGGTLLVLGTPAEENFGGKVSMANAGVFDDIDVAMMVHPSDHTGVGGRSNALQPVKFEFFGKTAHGCNPETGKSALDAAVMSFLQINLMRQFVAPHTYIHGVIKHGGEAANVIPAYASLEYYFRAPKMKYAVEVSEKAIAAAKGIAAANGVTLETSVYECPYEDTVINYKLAEILTEKYHELGIEEVAPVSEIGKGSSDVGAASYKCPTIQGYIQIVPKGVSAHTLEMASATVSEDGKKGLIKAAEALGFLGLELLENPEALKAVKEEYATEAANF